MTGTGALDFAVLGSPTVLRHTDWVTLSQPSDSSSCAGSNYRKIKILCIRERVKSWHAHETTSVERITRKVTRRRSCAISLGSGRHSEAVIRLCGCASWEWSRGDRLLTNCLRRESLRPFHFLALIVEKRIPSEISLYRICPAARLGTRPWLLSQNGKDGFRSLP
jgi:hypothetical protein